MCLVVQAKGTEGEMADAIEEMISFLIVFL